ncbi:Signal transduction histidine kinase [Sporobacter termitidis DSM 10068]|uniref:histidine kinase n=1 Tax=Sporobacter termitidis DSM 10068 TaxID=1123282 RepID=A0A1M5WJQ9_9FIRM|nr:histidine kinase [Sporobacter termitidis]SHH87809.1 Signal transduction histidine kinase [Sporobacter termitidis DSM 10068]
MEAYRELLKKNEAAVNLLASRVSRIELYIMILIGILCKYYVMYVPGFTLGRMLALILAPLLLPTLIVDVLGIKEPWVKYAVLTCSVIASGLCYAAFTFQLMLILIFPTVVAALYYNKRLMTVVCAESVVNIFFSHILSNFIMFAQILEPFKGIRNIIQFAALPRIFIYLCFAVVFWILSTRTSDLMLNIHRVTQEKELLELRNSMTEKVTRYEEREKISRDIHNSVGHTITAAIMAIEAAEAIRSVSTEMADAKVAVAGERMRESLQVIRDSVRLVDSRDTSVSLGDLVKTLTICLRQFEMDANVRIHNNFGDMPRDILGMSINAEQARFLYGAAQECLTNSVKHGKAGDVTLNISIVSDYIEMVTADNGNGKPPPESGENKGFGLKKIDAYLKANGGHMTFKSGPGVTVTIWLPIEEAY